MIVKPNDPDLPIARRNREALLDALAADHFAELPAGITFLDQELRLGPEHAPCTLAGLGSAVSTLKAVYEAHHNKTLSVEGTGYRDPGPTEHTLAEGALALPVALFNTAHSRVLVTDGPVYQDPLRGEFRRLGPDGRTFDRPLRRGYAQVRAAEGSPAAGVTLCDLTIAQPWHPYAIPFFARRALGLRLERVRLGLPGEATSASGIAESGGVTLLDCASAAPFGFNTTHDVTVRGGRLGSLVFEESCLDADVQDLLIIPAGQAFAGLSFYLGSERLRAANVRIEGGGALNPAGGTFSPLGVWGRQCRLEGVEVCASVAFISGWSGCGLGGEELVAEGLRLDLPAAVTEGADVRLLRSCAKWWELYADTTGRMADCAGPVAAHEPGSWVGVGAAARAAGAGVTLAEAARLWQTKRTNGPQPEDSRGGHAARTGSPPDASGG